VRLALGAAPATVRRSMSLVMLRLVAVGIGLGIAASVLLWRGVESQLYATRATDPVVLAGSAAMLALAGLLASYGPVRRAAATDPAGLLHEE